MKGKDSMANYKKEMKGLQHATEGLEIAIRELTRVIQETAGPASSRRLETSAQPPAPPPTRPAGGRPATVTAPQERRDEVVSIKRIADALNLNVATIKRMSARGDFPAPLKIPIRKSMYLRSDLDAFWRERLGGLDNSGNWNGSRFPLKPVEPGDHEEGPRQSS